jgi:subtilisin family serine protease
MSSSVKIAAVGAAAAIFFGAAAALAAPVPDSPDALLAEFKQSPHAKIGPWLGNLYEEYQQARGKGAADKAFRSSNKTLRVADGMVAIDALALDPAALQRSLRELGATNLRVRGPLVSARVPVSALGQLASVAALRSARPVMAITNALPEPVVSQGDVSLKADLAREAQDVDGSGIEVGTLSDSFECNPPAFLPGAPTSTRDEDVSNGELPVQVTVLDNGPCPGSDEGRAMAQLVHDVAPGAAISFHSAFNSEIDFADGIIELEEAGADVIVDDVIYFSEPMFSDGPIAQAVDIVTARGVPYFSAAGNQARASYESAYRGVDVLTNAGRNLNGGKAVVRRFHDFDPGPGVQILQPVAVIPDGGAGFIIFSFQWDQPHLTATTYARMKAGQDPALAVGATSDLDMVIFDYRGHVVRRCPPGTATGITCQITGDRNIGGDAVDIAAIYYAGPPKAPQVFYVGFVRSGGGDPGVVKYAVFESQGFFATLDFNTASGTAFGHANAAGAMSIGAASWYATVPWSTGSLGPVPPNDTPPEPGAPFIDLSPCNPACLNDFSSAGNIPIYFDRFGTRLAQAERRLNPSVTGPDGGNTTFFFFDSSYDDDDGNGLNSPVSEFITRPTDEPGNEYPNFFGTSASAPHVAAVAALMLEKNAGLTPAQVRSTLESTARPISTRFVSDRPIALIPIEEVGPAGYDFDSGFGLVDAAAALEAIAGD